MDSDKKVYKVLGAMLQPKRVLFTIVTFGYLQYPITEQRLEENPKCGFQEQGVQLSWSNLG